MSRRRWNFSVLQLLLLTALCGLCAGVVAVSRQAAGSAYLENLLFSPDGKWLAACNQGEVRVWNLERKRLHASSSVRAGGALHVDFRGAGFIDRDTFVASRYGYDTESWQDLVLWDVRQDKLKKTLPTSTLAYRYCVSASGKVVVVNPNEPSSSFVPSTMQVRDLANGEADSLVKSDGYVDGLLFSSDGKILAARVGRDRSDATLAYRLSVWDISSSSERSLGEPKSPWLLALSEDGKRVAALAGDDAVLKVWDSGTGRELASISPGNPWPQSLEFSANGQQLIMRVASDAIEVWDIASAALAKGFSESALARQQNASFIRVSPDGRWIATGSENMISLWDAKTFAHVADLYRDRRGWAGLAYMLGFVTWAAAWGWLARRQRARDKDRSDPAEAVARPLPKIVRAGLQPRQTWLRLLLIALGFGIALAWVFADGVQRQLGWSYPASLLALVPVCTVGFLLLVIGLALGLNVVPATIRRWRGVPFTAAITRAERAAGVSARRMQLGPVTACFFGQSHLEATLAEDFETARRRFESLFGAPVELRRPLTVLVFERTDWYDAHLDGHLPMAGVYWMGIDRQITICEEMCLQWMTEPRWIWRQLVARYLFEQHKGFPPSTGLAGILSCSLLLDLDEHLPQRVHRRLQSMLRRGDPVGTLEALNWNDRQLVSAALDQQNRESFLTMAAYQTQSLSLAAYLLGGAAGERVERFQSLVRQWRRGDSLPERLQYHVGMDAGAFPQAWQQWILQHPTQPSGRPTPRIERYFQTRMLPLIVDSNAPLSDRALAIRHLGLDGYELGIDALIGLLQDRQAARLRPDVVWALESISGRLLGDEVAAWQQWWSERREQIANEQSGESAADEADVFVAALADDASQPVTAELADEPLAAVGIADGEERKEAGDPPGAGGRALDDSGEVGILTNSATGEVGILTNPATGAVVPPGRLKAVWILLGIGGLIAVGWSVYLTLYMGESLMFVSVLGILAGAYAMTRWTGAETVGLPAAARLLALCIMLLNLPSCLIGLFAAWQLRHPQVRHYLQR
jgi:WD40 repeat protein